MKTLKEFKESTQMTEARSKKHKFTPGQRIKPKIRYQGWHDQFEFVKYVSGRMHNQDCVVKDLTDGILIYMNSEDYEPA